MKAFLRKHRFKIVLTILIIVFVYICFYMLWVHVPYMQHKNDLVSIQEEICDKYQYSYNGYFNEFQNNKTNYIVKVKKKKKSLYVVCNQKLKRIDTFEGKAISKKEVKDAFFNKYQVKATSIEIGYENDQFVYCLTYKGKDTLLYAFYSLDQGEFLKAYKL